MTNEMPRDVIRGGSLAHLQQPVAPYVVSSQPLRLPLHIAAAEYQLVVSYAQRQMARTRFMPGMGRMHSKAL